MLQFYDFALIGIAAILAGVVNALAGGGTLITFPTLTAIGIPVVMANITNTIELLPGYIGGTLAQWDDMKAQAHRLRLILPISVLGGMIGGILLLKTGEKVFRQIVPYLILFASLLLAVQEPVRAYLVRHAERVSRLWTTMSIGLAAIYGGYFGAGLSVIVLAALGLTMDESLTKLNALKQAISLNVNVAAAVFFRSGGLASGAGNGRLRLLGGWLGDSRLSHSVGL